MDPVIHRLTPAERRRRTWDERLIARYPSAYGPLGWLAVHLPRRSGIRRWMLTRTFESGWAAISRHDYGLMLTRYRRDVEFHMAPRWLITANFEPVTHGHDGLRKTIDQMTDAFPEWTFVPQYLLDFGTRFVTLGRMQIGARTSGLHVDVPFGQVIETRGGYVTRERDFNDFDETLVAAGFAADEAARLLSELGLSKASTTQTTA